jgi:replicative DNA helicase
MPPVVDLIADSELEASLLAALLANPDHVRLIEPLLPIEAITTLELRSAYDDLRRGALTASLSLIAPPSSDVLADARTLAELHATRAAHACLADVGAITMGVRAGTHATTDLERSLVEALEAVRSTRSSPEPLAPASALVDAVLEDLVLRAHRRETTGSALLGVRTDFPALDDCIGGLEPKTVTLLAARPNFGKTTLVNQWAYIAASAAAGDGVPVLYVSFENPPDDLVRKQLTRLAGVNATDVLRGRADLATITGAGQQFVDQVGSRLVYLRATAHTTVAAIQRQAERLRQDHQQDGTAPPVLVIIDYLQKLALTEGSSGGEDMRHRVSRVVQELRDLAHALDSPVLAISSVNRTAYANSSDRPGMANLKESGDLEYAADVVLLLADEQERETGAKEKETPPPPGFRAIWLEVAKNRYGVTGSIPLLFAHASGRFAERVRESVGFTKAAR